MLGLKIKGGFITDRRQEAAAQYFKSSKFFHSWHEVLGYLMAVFFYIYPKHGLMIIDSCVL